MSSPLAVGLLRVVLHIPESGSLKSKRQVISGSVQLSETLLEDFQLAAVPGLPFGAEGYLRMSFATSREIIEKGLLRLKNFVGQLS